eukprot:87225_1
MYNMNVSTVHCDIPPPSPEECAQIPLCETNDYPNTTAIGSICSVGYTLCSCYSGFMFVDPTNLTAKPPAGSLEDISSKLPQPNLSSPHCYERMYPYTRACCPGHYCPPSLYCMIPCDNNGSYCPSSDTLSYPSCDMTYVAGGDPTGFALQYPALMGCGGAYLADTVCPNGSYCTNSSIKQQCPSGYYCRAGSSVPSECSLFMACPAGTSLTEESTLALVCFAILFICLVFVIRVYKYQEWSMGLFFWTYKKYYGVDWHEIRLQHKTNVKTLFTDDDIYTISSSDDTKRYKAPHVSDEPRPEYIELSKAESFHVEDEKQSANIAEKLNFFMDIEFTDLSLHLKSNNQTILDHCSGYIHSGTVNAIMGPSGAGKTSFLYTLCGKASAYGNVTGDIRINGEPKAIRDFKDVVAFVPQSDAMTAEMTVKEMLEFNAKFRLSSGCSHDYRRSVVRDVLKLLKIQKIRHSRIGDDIKRGISGGQQKRVNIGMELVSQPSVLFLDEPTSGLDSTTSNDVMDVLKHIAKRGTTIVVVLHQPRYEIYEAFDNVILLAEGGKMVYMGDTSKALPYFEQLGYRKPNMVNPADFLMDILSDAVLSSNTTYQLNGTQNLEELWKNCDKTKFNMKVNKHFNRKHHHKNNSKYTKRKKLSVFHQTAMCTIRALKVMWRQKWTMASDVIMIALTGLVLGFVIDSTDIRNIPCSTFLTILSSSIVGCIVSLRIFGTDRIMYYRFASCGINRFAYYSGGLIATAPWNITQPLFFLLLYWPMAKPRGDLMTYALLLVLTMFCVQGLGQLISVLVEPNKAILFAVVLVIITNFFNGFEPTLNSMTGFPQIASNVAYSRWIQEAFWMKEINSFTEIFDDVKQEQHLYFGWELEDEAFKKDILIALIIGCVFRLLTFLALLFVNRAKQL